VDDKNFEMFFRARRQSQQQRDELFETAIPKVTTEELNLGSLTAYLQSKFPTRRHGDSKAVSALVGELLQAGYKTLGDIDHIVNKTQTAVGLYEQENRLRPMPGPIKLTDIGALRIAVRILDEDYYRKIHPSGNNVVNWDESAVQKAIENERRMLAPYRRLLRQELS